MFFERFVDIISLLRDSEIGERFFLKHGCVLKIPSLCANEFVAWRNHNLFQSRHYDVFEIFEQVQRQLIVLLKKNNPIRGSWLFLWVLVIRYVTYVIKKMALLGDLLKLKDAWFYLYKLGNFVCSSASLIFVDYLFKIAPSTALPSVRTSYKMAPSPVVSIEKNNSTCWCDTTIYRGPMSPLFIMIGSEPNLQYITQNLSLKIWSSGTWMSQEFSKWLVTGL